MDSNFVRLESNFLAAGDNSAALHCGGSIFAGNSTFGGKGINFGAEKSRRSD